MERAIVVRGRLEDARHIELAEPVEELQGEVEVVLRSVLRTPPPGKAGVFDLIRQLPAGRRSNVEIDEQLRTEREE